MNNYNRPSFLSSIPPVVKNILFLNIIFWLASVITPGLFNKFGVNSSLSDLLGMHYWASAKFNPVQLITYMFMHAGFEHIFFNMFALYMFGGVLESVWGPKKFLLYYLLTGLGAALVQQIFWTIEFSSAIAEINHVLSLQPSNIIELLQEKAKFLNMPITVGASGAVFGLLLAFGWLFPEAKLMMLFFPVPIKARIFVVIYGVTELFLGAAQFPGDHIAHFAHLGGMLFGIILILYWKRKSTF